MLHLKYFGCKQYFILKSLCSDYDYYDNQNKLMKFSI